MMTLFGGWGLLWRIWEGQGRTADPSAPLRSPGFPVDLCGVGALPAPFFTEGRMRGDFRRSVAGNPGPVGMTKGRVALSFDIGYWDRWNSRSLHFAALRSG
jgi:hypothetical protein